MPERYAAVADYCHAKGFKERSQVALHPARWILPVSSVTWQTALINVAGQTSLKSCSRCVGMLDSSLGLTPAHYIWPSPKGPPSSVFTHTVIRGELDPTKGFSLVADYTDILTSRGQKIEVSNGAID